MVRRHSLLLIGLAVAATPANAETRTSADAPSETREEYLDRLRFVCEADCMEPRDLLRTARRVARKEGRVGSDEMAGILDIFSVTEWNGKYLLHAGALGGFDDFGFPFPGSNRIGRLTPFSVRPVTSPGVIVVELDRQTFFDLLNVPLPGKGRSGEPVIDEDGNIIVSKDRFAKLSKPTLRKLRSVFRNRRIAVRGSPRLEVTFVGARRNFRRKKLFLEVSDPGNIVLLPRYDKDGNPRPEDLPWLAASRQKDG